MATPYLNNALARPVRCAMRRGGGRRLSFPALDWFTVFSFSLIKVGKSYFLTFVHLGLVVLCLVIWCSICCDVGAALR